MAKIKREDLEGIINVNADVTPITREPIEQVDASDWSTMSIPDLNAQLATLQKRYNYALHLGNPDLVKQLKRGIDHLMLILKTKSKLNNLI